MLNPVFSQKNLRELLPIFTPITHQVGCIFNMSGGKTKCRQLEDVLTHQVKISNGKDVDVMKWVSRIALEFLGQGGLGYTFNALDESKKDTYSETLKEFGSVVKLTFM